MDKTHLLTLVIPTLNEADVIIPTIRTIALEIGESLARESEIIIVDDGTDRLPETVSAVAGAFPFRRIDVIKNETRHGKGASIKKGFSTSTAEVVGFIDADISVSPRHIREAVQAIRSRECHIFIGSRSSRHSKGQPLLNTLLGGIFVFVTRIAFFRDRASYRDTQCGFKFFDRDIAKHLFDDLVSKDGLVDLEVLVKAARCGYVVREKSVPRICSRESKRRLISLVRKETIELIKIALKYR